MSYQGQRWIRLGCLYPETVNCVEFCRNGALYYTSYDELFLVHFESTWRQGGVDFDPSGEEWTAKVHLQNGEIIEKHGSA